MIKGLVMCAYGKVRVQKAKVFCSSVHTRQQVYVTVRVYSQVQNAVGDAL